MTDNSTLTGGHGNYSTWTGNVEIAFIVADCLVLVLTFGVGIVANLFVAYAVWHQKSLQTSNNALLVNLAIVDFIRCSTDCPLLLVVVVSGRKSQDLGPLLCSTQTGLFSLNCCVQLLTLASISAERYQAIAYPFKSAQRRKRVMAWIPLTWAVSMLISVLCVLFAKDSPVYVRCRGVHLQELQTYDSFGLYMLFPVWCSCLATILGFYSQIFILVKAHSRKIFDKGISLPSREKDEANEKSKTEKTEEAQKTIGTEAVMAHETENVPVTVEINGQEQKLSDLQMNFNRTTVTESQLSSGAKSLEMSKTEDLLHQPMSKMRTFASELPQDQRDHQLTLQNVTLVSEMSPNQPENQPTSKSLTFDSEVASNQHENQPTLPTGTLVSDLPRDQHDHQSTLQDLTFISEHHPNQPEHRHVTFASEVPHSPPDLIPTEGTEDPNTPKAADVTPVPAEQNADTTGAVCMMPSFANKDKGNKKKEGKLAKRSGYIILTFLIFWIPLMGTVLLNAFLERHQNPNVQIVQELEMLAVSIACMTSLTNPIIYAAVNPQFRNEFYNLKTRCKKCFCKNMNG